MRDAAVKAHLGMNRGSNGKKSELELLREQINQKMIEPYIHLPLKNEHVAFGETRAYREVLRMIDKLGGESE